MNYKGKQYTFELDCDGDCVKILHHIDGQLLDFSPYQKMDSETLAMIVDGRLYKRMQGMSSPWDRHTVSRFYLSIDRN